MALYLPHHPRLRYLLLDEGRYTESELPTGDNVAAALFRMENSQEPADVQQVLRALVTWLHAPEHDSLRRAFTVWLKRVFLPARLPHGSLPDVQDMMEVQAMLAERVIEWTQRWKEEGLREGIQQGIQQGQAEERQRTLASERALLLRLVRKRFGEDSAQALAPLLEARQDTESLAEIGEWIVTDDTGEELLTKVHELFPSA